MPWAPPYVDAADDLGSYLRVVDDIVDLPEMELAVEAASRAVDDATGRQFGQVEAVEERFYTARYDYEECRWVVDVDDYQTATGMLVEVDGTAVATFTKEPVNAAGKGRPWTRIGFTTDSEATPTGVVNEVAATVRWGWTAFPVTVKQATLLQSSRFFTRRNAPFGVAGSPDQGSELRLLAKLDPDVAVMLRPYRRVRGIG